MQTSRRANKPNSFKSNRFSNNNQKSSTAGQSGQRSYKKFNTSPKSTNDSYGYSSSANQGGYRHNHGDRRTNQGRSRRFSENIDISKFIQRTPIRDIKTKYSAKNSFEDFDFSKTLKSNLEKKQYTIPTPIQDQSIKYIMEGRDLIGLANTGTGKTAAFLLPMIEKVYRNHFEKVLIIAPTRELALQIDNELKSFSNGMRIYSAACVGGAPIGKQIYNLKRNPNFVIGTPGRLKDLSERRLISFEKFQNIILDEVDRMLDMGFVDEITTILNQLPRGRQCLFFSATMPTKIRILVKQFLNDPVTVEVKSGNTAENIMQDIVKIHSSDDKFIKLQELLVAPDMTKVLIFSETKHEVEKLAVNLSKNGLNAESIHGDKRQSQRQRSLSAFRNDEVKILVATDVAARGLDIDDISHVINYTVPQTYDDYIHRIGRTGRGDKKGMALTFVESR
ncbi:MAG: DEAD-box ATP-dependent RNA helicase CshA [bacterium ADurb.Bin212]|nr:MAG: DEAD-box ATP-dependent RNA helicase CshA [bacterium ADurb.Bin212]